MITVERHLKDVAVCLGERVPAKEPSDNSFCAKRVEHAGADIDRSLVVRESHLGTLSSGFSFIRL